MFDRAFRHMTSNTTFTHSNNRPAHQSLPLHEIHRDTRKNDTTRHTHLTLSSKHVNSKIELRNRIQYDSLCVVFVFVGFVFVFVFAFVFAFVHALVCAFVFAIVPVFVLFCAPVPLGSCDVRVFGPHHIHITPQAPTHIHKHTSIHTTHTNTLPSCFLREKVHTKRQSTHKHTQTHPPILFPSCVQNTSVSTIITWFFTTKSIPSRYTNRTFTIRR